MKISLATKITGALALAGAGVMFTGIEMEYLRLKLLDDLDRENSTFMEQYSAAISYTCSVRQKLNSCMERQNEDCSGHESLYNEAWRREETFKNSPILKRIDQKLDNYYTWKKTAPLLSILGIAFTFGYGTVSLLNLCDAKIKDEKELEEMHREYICRSEEPHCDNGENDGLGFDRCGDSPKPREPAEIFLSGIGSQTYIHYVPREDSDPCLEEKLQNTPIEEPLLHSDTVYSKASRINNFIW